MFPRNTAILVFAAGNCGTILGPKALYLYPSMHTDPPSLFRLCFANASRPEKAHLWDWEGCPELHGLFQIQTKAKQLFMLLKNHWHWKRDSLSRSSPVFSYQRAWAEVLAIPVEATTTKERVTSLRTFAYQFKSAQSKGLHRSLHWGPPCDANSARDTVASPHAYSGEATKTPPKML